MDPSSLCRRTKPRSNIHCGACEICQQSALTPIPTLTSDNQIARYPLVDNEAKNRNRLSYPLNLLNQDCIQI